MKYVLRVFSTCPLLSPQLRAIHAFLFGDCDSKPSVGATATDIAVEATV